MNVGGDVTSYNDENGGREWLSAASMTFNGGLAVDLKKLNSGKMTSKF